MKTSHTVKIKDKSSTKDLEIAYNLYLPQHASKGSIVMLHGWGASKDLYDQAAHFLTKESQYKVYCIDFPGFGGSSEQCNPWKTQDYSNFVAHVIKQLSIENIQLLAGHSHGGRVCIDGIARKLFLPKKVALIGSAGIKSKRSLKVQLKIKCFKILRWFVEHFVPNPFKQKWLDKARAFFGSADYKAASHVLRESLKNVVNHDLTDSLSSLTMPTLLIWGDKDTDTPLWMAQKMEKLIPDAGLVVFEDSSHYSFLEQPHKFNAVLKAFLD